MKRKHLLLGLGGCALLIAIPLGLAGLVFLAFTRGADDHHALMMLGQDYRWYQNAVGVPPPDAESLFSAAEERGYTPKSSRADLARLNVYWGVKIVPASPRKWPIVASGSKRFYEGSVAVLDRDGKFDVRNKKELIEWEQSGKRE